VILSIHDHQLFAIIVGGSWNQMLVSSIIPHIDFTPTFALIFVATFGATMSPYIFFWQASEQAEEDVVKQKIKEISEYDRDNPPRISKKEFRLMRLDVAIVMALSQLIM
jgi:Mn2+/Fe2+ NRAMP family transporter